jgi:hypothetical protein
MGFIGSTGPKFDWFLACMSEGGCLPKRCEPDDGYDLFSGTEVESGILKDDD